MSRKALRCVTLAALLGLVIVSDTATATRRPPSNASSSSDDSSDATAPSPVPVVHASSAPTSAAHEMSTLSPAAMTVYTAAPTMAMMPAGNGTAFNGTDTPSPNMPIPKPECNSTQPVSIRYSATTGRLYLEAGVEGERGGCVTVDQIWEARGGGTAVRMMIIAVVLYSVGGRCACGTNVEICVCLPVYRSVCLSFCLSLLV